MNIKDIAKLAGVSVSTVSRVVNGGDSSAASPATKERIWKVVRETGYVPNQHAQNLKNISSSKAFPLSKDIDCVYARTDGQNIDEFFSSLMHAVEVEAFAQGYNLHYQYSIRDALAKDTPFLAPTTNSAIVLGRVTPEDMNFLKKHYKNLILASLQQTDYDVDQVVSSGYQAACKCVEYLISLGHKNICYLGETINEQRYDGYRDSMKKNNATLSDELVVQIPFLPTNGYKATNDLLTRQIPFTAILCANDMLAMGALRALKEHKLSVPDDISVIGINDMEASSYLTPMLTTIHIPIEEMGTHAARLLIDRINKKHRLPACLMVPNNLVVRESCGPASRKLSKPIFFDTYGF